MKKSFLFLIVALLVVISVSVNAQTPTITFNVLPKYVGAVGNPSTLENPIACFIQATGLEANTNYDGLHTGFIQVNSTSTRGSKWEPSQAAGWVSPSVLILSKYRTDAAGNFSTWIYLRPPTDFFAGVDTCNVRFRIQKNGTANTINTDSPTRLTCIRYLAGPVTPTAGAIIYGYVNPLPVNLGSVILAYRNASDAQPMSAWLIYKETSTFDTLLYNTRMDPDLRSNGYFQLLVPPNTTIGKLEIRNSQNVILSSQTSTQWISGAPGTMTDIGSQDPITLNVRQEDSNIPEKYNLFQNYPNPFNPTTEIKFQIANEGFVIMKIYDVLGKEVATLVNEELQPGSYSTMWDAAGLSGGLYFYKIQSGNFIETKKMILVK